jgi:hypothetical protein
MKDIDEVGIVYPQVALPGALAIAASNRNMPRLRLLQGAGPTLYTVKAVVGTHIPLIGTIESIVALSPETGLSVHKPPLSMYLHSGGRNAVFLDLTAKVDGTLSTIDAEVDADSPAGALAGMRSAVNQFLDVLMRKLWLPLVLVRLDLYVGIGADSQLVAHELQVPFVGTMQIGPIGGIHQYPLFSELESLAREGICSTSPFYRFLCAYRLYEGTGALRTQLRQMCKDASIIEPLPKDTKVDHSFLEAMGIDGLTSQNIRTVGDLHGKFTELRNMVAHFILTKGEKLPPLHISDGYSCRAFSNAAAVLLHYSVDALTNLSSFFQEHLSAVVSIGSVLPMQSQREKYRIVVRSIQKANNG